MGQNVSSAQQQVKNAIDKGAEDTKKKLNKAAVDVATDVKKVKDKLPGWAIALIVVGTILFVAAIVIPFALIATGVISNNNSEKGNDLRTPELLQSTLNELEGNTRKCQDEDRELPECINIAECDDPSECTKDNRFAHYHEAGCTGPNCVYGISQALCSILDCVNMKLDDCFEYGCKEEFDEEGNKTKECYKCYMNPRCCHVEQKDGCLDCELSERVS